MSCIIEGGEDHNEQSISDERDAGEGQNESMDPDEVSAFSTEPDSIARVQNKSDDFENNQELSEMSLT